MKIGLCYTIISAETKMMLEAAQKKGVALERIPDSEAVLRVASSTNGFSFPDVLLQRSVSYSRGLYLTYYYERNGSKVINSYNAARICGDKMLCSLELSKAGVPTPKTSVCFSPDSVFDAAEEIGFPFVMKPVMGSWARMVHRINDPDALEMEVGSREGMGNAWQKVYYLQEHVNKPGRDIRAFVVGDQVVAAMYRNATEQSGWLTNASRGAHTTPCPLYPELVELALKAARFCGPGVYGVDLMESERGLVVHEINHTAEFKGCTAATGVDIAGAVIDYAVSCAKR